MSDINRYLRIIDQTSPAGEDLEYDDLYMQMEDLATNAEVSIATADEESSKEADYKTLLKNTSALLERTQDLRVAVFHTIALTATQGFRGLHDGLTLLKYICDNLWDAAYPRLDPDDEFDPTERINIISTLSPVSINDPFSFLLLLIHRQICSTLPITCRHIKIAKGIINNADIDCDIVLLKGQVISLPDTIYVQDYQLIYNCLKLVQEIEQDVNAKLNDGAVISLNKLVSELQFIMRFFDEARGRPEAIIQAELQAEASGESVNHDVSASAAAALAATPSLAVGQVGASGHGLNPAMATSPTAAAVAAAAATIAGGDLAGMGQSHGTHGMSNVPHAALHTAGAGAGGMAGVGPNGAASADFVPLAAYQQLQAQVLQLQSQVQAQMQSISMTNQVDSLVIESRKDALALIEKCRVFFQKREPTSPVPFLLQRALNMADMNFIELLGEIDSSALERGREQLGVKRSEDQ